MNRGRLGRDVVTSIRGWLERERARWRKPKPVACPCPRHFGEVRPSKSFGIHFDSRILVRADGRSFLWPDHYDGPLTPRGARSPSSTIWAWVPSRSVTRSRAFPLWVWSERRRAGQRLRIDDCYGWPIGASHDRTAPRVGKRGAFRGSMLRWTFAVWVPFSPSPSTLS